MKIIVELDAPELQQVTKDGTLQALTASCMSLKPQENPQIGQAPEQVTAPIAPVIPVQQITVPVAVPTAPIMPPVQVQTAPVAQPVQAMPAVVSAVPAAPIIPPAPVQMVPTTAPTYSTQDLAMAGTQLVDAGRRQEVLDLLTAFGCTALTELPKEQYSAYASKLREMGAKI